MATAILAILVPKAFPVMDRWTVQAVFGPGPPKRAYNKRAYCLFAKRLVELARSHFPTCEAIHKVDQMIMNAEISGSEEATNTQPAFDAISLSNR